MSDNRKIQTEVNRLIKAMGRKERLVAGRGYCYFTDGNTSSWHQTAVYVNSISQLTVASWMEEFNTFVSRETDRG